MTVSKNSTATSVKILSARIAATLQIMTQLPTLFQSYESSFLELAKLITNDDGFSLKILSVANSAAYIRDSGAGMTAEALAKLFSPGRSIKAGENRCIGLRVLHKKVKILSGWIDCQRDTTRRTFELLLQRKKSKKKNPNGTC